MQCNLHQTRCCPRVAEPIILTGKAAPLQEPCAFTWNHEQTLQQEYPPYLDFEVEQDNATTTPEDDYIIGVPCHIRTHFFGSTVWFVQLRMGNLDEILSACTYYTGSLSKNVQLKTGWLQNPILGVRTSSELMRTRTDVPFTSNVPSSKFQGWKIWNDVITEAQVLIEMHIKNQTLKCSVVLFWLKFSPKSWTLNHRRHRRLNLEVHEDHISTSFVCEVQHQWRKCRGRKEKQCKRLEVFETLRSLPRN